MSGTRPPLRPLQEQVFTPTGGAERPNAAHIAKRKRSSVITPGSGNTSVPLDTPGLLSDRNEQLPHAWHYVGHENGFQGHAQIKEMEEQLARSQQRQNTLERELLQKQGQVEQLELGLARAHVAGASQAQQAHSSQVADMERLLGAKESKMIELEAKLNTAQEQMRAAEQRAAQATAGARRASADRVRELQEAELAADANVHRLQSAQAQLEEQLQEARTDAKMERAQREADQAVLKAAQQQLNDVRGRLASTQRTRDAGTSAAALACKVQQLEVALEDKEAEIRAATSKSVREAAAGHPGHSRGASASPMPMGAASRHDATPAAWSRGPLLLAMEQASHALPTCSAAASVAGGAALTVDSAAAVVHDLIAHIAQLRRAAAEQDDELVKLRAIAHRADAQSRSLTSQMGDRRTEAHSLIAAKMGLERQLKVVTAERDSLRRALVAPPAAPSAVPHGGAGGEDASIAAPTSRINCEQLQAHVEKLSAKIHTLEHDALAAAQAEEDLRKAVAQANSRADAAEVRATQLEKEADALGLEVGALHAKLGRGEVDRSSVRVLHLKMNPEEQFHREQANSVLCELRAENSVLKAHLAELAQEVEDARRRDPSTRRTAGSSAEHAGDEDGGVTAIAQRDAQLAVLKHRLSEMEKTMVRLKEVTKERIFAFREACYCLFGYRVDMTSEATAAKDAAKATTTFSLRPQHADDSGMQLVFRYTKAKGMQHVPNASSARMSREVDTFIHKFSCIPAFTANLTMENFQKQTQC